MRVGIIALQGSVEEHVRAAERALSEGCGGEVISVKHADIVPSCDAIIIPGGESTTIGRLMLREGIVDEIKSAAKHGVPILGTCAGLILLARYGLMDIHVTRNAFGRQRESFETPLKIDVIGEKPFNAVFIRAPAITKVGEDVEILAKCNGYIVAAKQDKLVALAFHPELTRDPRLHHFFFDLV
ncbi:MAG: pyridoxal 5'-phosphate synthase glutaminase subunit PdxT [Methanocellales archaeon]|nr:pyridoxal 5'-phosphate synthase glutaminase subunit PdxT [Methanocellales archaeon]